MDNQYFDPNNNKQHKVKIIQLFFFSRTQLGYFAGLRHEEQGKLIEPHSRVMIESLTQGTAHHRKLQSQRQGREWHS